MEWISQLTQRLKALLSRRRLDRDLQDEFSFHLGTIPMWERLISELAGPFFNRN
jgi:hypothetical protein